MTTSLLAGASFAQWSSSSAAALAAQAQRFGRPWRALLDWLQPDLAPSPILERRLEPGMLTPLRPSGRSAVVAAVRPIDDSIHPRASARPRGRALVQVAPGDLRHTLISGRMAEVCEMLDLLVAREAAAH